ncbi:MAG: hypothetical protein KDD63_02350 [Bacteroidetes bacterium]|nr:hypothetical protein [Bacteroidota bacterium]
MSITKYIITGLLVAFVFIACKNGNEEIVPTGDPIVHYVRVTPPESSDSLLVAAFQGSLIAIIGENLAHANDIWFNDQQAELNPVYVTNKSILVNVPLGVPKEVSNQLRIYFSNGDSLLHNFEVDISKPQIGSMKSEYVFAGEVATIYGNFFYEPLTVTFSGGVEGTVLPAEDEDGTVIKVVVPDGAEKGPITVTTNFGSEESDFWFRDDRNIIISSDPFTGWWNASYVVVPDSVGIGDPPAINGNYIRITKVIGAWEWTEVAGGPSDAMGDISKNFPADAILNPENYNVKFEINTLKPYNNNIIRLNLGLQSETNDAYYWRPPYDSQGNWETVVIPLDEIFRAYEEVGITPTVNPNGYWTRLMIFDGNELDCDIAFDNFRVVPKILN